MKLPPLLAAALLSVSAFGQTTNTVQAIRLTFTDEVGATNNTTLNPDSDEAAGFMLVFTKDKLVAQQLTNPVPSFQNSIRGTTRDYLLKPLGTQARADDQKTNKINLFWQYGPALWEAKAFTAQQKNDIKAILAAPNIATNLPAQ